MESTPKEESEPVEEEASAEAEPEPAVQSEPETQPEPKVEPEAVPAVATEKVEVKDEEGVELQEEQPTTMTVDESTANPAPAPTPGPAAHTPDSERATPLDSLEAYEAQIAKFRKVLVGCQDKHNLVLYAIQEKDILHEPVQKGLKKMVDRIGDWDMACQPLIRLLYLGDSAVEEIAQTKKFIITACRRFRFWPDAGQAAQANFEKIIFWSENHIFMTLGVCYLFRAYMSKHFKLEEGEDKLEADLRKEALRFQAEKSLETKLLKVYLRAHCTAEFNGIYEVNSCVYLPYTLSALWNLYDFAYDEEIKILAGCVIDRIVEHLLTCTTLSGVVNLAAAGRSFLRQRVRNFGHNINQLLNLLVDSSGDKMEASSITDFILTTTWRPNFEEAKEAWMLDGTSEPLCLGHPWQATRKLYETLAQEEGIPSAELVPFFWSAGLVTHPEYVLDTKAYMREKLLNNNKHLSALSYLGPSTLQRVLTNYATLSEGQVYCGVTLHVYKRPAAELLLTSFEDFNAHRASFQQLPWIANVGGVGVWSQSGNGERVHLFGVFNTHNPLVRQKGSVLIASHAAPASLTSRMIMGNLFSYSVRVFWPHKLMDECCVFGGASPVEQTVALDAAVNAPGVWMAGRRGGAYVAVYCSQRTKMDHRKTADAEYVLRADPWEEEVTYDVPRRVCDQYRNSWVVVVGTTKEYPTLQAFVDRCLRILIAEQNGGSGWVFRGSEYKFDVTDPVEGHLGTSITLPV